ncbi:MAG: hypothetical protein LW815_06130 [Chitinophagaceae bacterium]|nr:hypothetical protein [Chitinophagaceae bacterium]
MYIFQSEDPLLCSVQLAVFTGPSALKLSSHNNFQIRFWVMVTVFSTCFTPLPAMILTIALLCEIDEAIPETEMLTVVPFFLKEHQDDPEGIDTSKSEAFVCT